MEQKSLVRVAGSKQPTQEDLNKKLEELLLKDHAIYLTVETAEGKSREIHLY